MPEVGYRCYLPFQIAVHDCEENLEEKVHGIYQYRQKVQPCFAGHHLECALSLGTRYLGRARRCVFENVHSESFQSVFEPISLPVGRRHKRW